VNDEITLPEYISTTELAAELHVSKQTLWRRMRLAHIKSRRFHTKSDAYVAQDDASFLARATHEPWILGEKDTRHALSHD
jgi:hypothetical protein